MALLISADGRGSWIDFCILPNFTWCMWLRWSDSHSLSLVTNNGTKWVKGTDIFYRDAAAPDFL